MEKKFKVLRIIGTIWKTLAWIALVVGVLFSIGILLTSILGGGLLSQLGQEYSQMPEASWVFGAAGGIVGLVVSLVITILYFLAMYAIGELIYLLLAIEENTRLAAQWIQTHSAPPAYSPPYPPASQS